MTTLSGSVFAPLATSRNTFLRPAPVSWRTGAVTLCPSVDTPAQPYFTRGIMLATYAKRRPFGFNALIFLHES